MGEGIEVYGDNGVLTLGMEDFTLLRIWQITLPSSKTAGVGIRSDHILYDIPGYDPATCFIVITPKQYSPNPQGSVGANWGYLPTYKELGGSKIGLVTYANYSRPTGDRDKRTYLWTSHIVECVVEAVRFA